MCCPRHDYESITCSTRAQRFTFWRLISVRKTLIGPDLSNLMHETRVLLKFGKFSVVSKMGKLNFFVSQRRGGGRVENVTLCLDQMSFFACAEPNAN